MLLSSLLLASLGACSAGPIKSCKTLAGPGWSTLQKPPANAAELLQLENLPGGSEVTWLANGSDRLLACYYAPGLNNPSCGGTTAYEFAAKDGHWASRNLRSEVCPSDSDS